MSSVVEEIGIMAAENVAEILDSGARAAAKPNAELWSTLAEGGWASITADTENGMELRDILEVARVTGRYAYTTPLVSTLLAGRWYDLDENQLDAGIALAFRRNDQIVAPYYSGTAVIIDGHGATVGGATAVENFAELCPLAVLAPATTAVGDLQLAEARAAFVAIAVGCADAVLAASANWATTREQFGQPLARFQAVRHHLANAHIAREQAWTAAIAAAHEPQISAMWARQGMTLARTAIELGIQVHGGVGFTWEVGIQHYLGQVIELESVLGVRR